jgi:hypothetical protein
LFFKRTEKNKKIGQSVIVISDEVCCHGVWVLSNQNWSVTKLHVGRAVNPRADEGSCEVPKFLYENVSNVWQEINLPSDEEMA